MLAYIIRRLLLMIPTLLGIMVINFLIIQFVPGGPIEQIIAQVTGTDVAATALRELLIEARAAGKDPRETYKIRTAVFASPATCHPLR